MSQAMVDRLFWRAGFGPTRRRPRRVDRQAGRRRRRLAAQHAPGRAASAPTRRATASALDPTGDDTDLVLAWVDRMVRTRNPLVERLTFFWHRHWANSREAVSPPQLLHDPERRCCASTRDLAANPTARFRDMALEVTKDPSMLRYLNGESNVKGGPNENYGRELMELFALGVTHAVTGAKNYSEDDVAQLAKALTGWHIDDTNPDNATALFDSGRWFNGPKIALRQARQLQAPTAPSTWCSARTAHAPFLVKKLWSEFMSTPPATGDAARAVDELRGAAARRSSRCCAQILTHPLLFESIDEPNMIKPPVVYVVGAMRALGVGVTLHAGPPTTSTRWARCPTSRRPWRAGRAASPG